MFKKTTGSDMLDAVVAHNRKETAKNVIKALAPTVVAIAAATAVAVIVNKNND